MGQTPTSRFEKARLEIARQHLAADEPLRPALERAMRISARALDTGRVGLWHFSQDRRTIRVDPQYSRATDSWTAGATLDVTRYPAYAEALESRRVIRAPHAHDDPRTRELVDDYLRPEGIGSLLDAPVFRGGEVVGIVCHEQVGPPREWSDRDVDFAVSVADMAGALLEQSARLSSEARLSRGLRLEALGRLAGACAHDVANLLSAIGLTAQDLLLQPAPTAATSHEAARTIVEQCELGGAMTRHLLAFARGAPAAPPCVVDLGELVHGARALLDPLVRDRAALEVDVEAGAHPVLADRAQLEQVVLNLVVNARDAIPPGRTGHVLVRVRAAAGPGPPAVLLAVEDDGVGMDAATRERAFEPFFTTKPRGSGMGLAIVYGAVHRAGGVIHIESTPGSGTTVLVRLPRV